MKRKTLSLTLALCLVFSLFTWCGLVSTAEAHAPPGNESSIDREPDMRYTQTCYIIPDSVNVAVGQSEYIQTSMGNHQTEHYTFFRWTSSDTSVATVDVYGNVTGVAPGTATINLAFTTPGHMEYDSCEVIVGQSYYIGFLEDGKMLSNSSNTLSKHFFSASDSYLQWVFIEVSSGVFTIRMKNNLNKCLTSVPITKSIIISDYTYGNTNQYWSMYISNNGNALVSCSTDTTIHNAKLLYTENGFKLSNTDYSPIGFIDITSFIQCSNINCRDMSHELTHNLGASHGVCELNNQKCVLKGNFGYWCDSCRASILEKRGIN